jgi:hypothetical protein
MAKNCCIGYHKAVLFKDVQVHTEDSGIKSSSNEIIQEQTDVLQGKNSIDATTKTSSTGGQQENLKIDACKTIKDKGRNKHKDNKSKVSFAQLLEKYQKESEAKSAYRPTSAKASRSPPRRNKKDRDWQRERFSAATSYPPFGPPMPMSWMPPYVDYYPYQSWSRYYLGEHHKYYSKPSRQTSVALMRSSVDQRSHVKDRLNESVQSPRKNNVVKQIWRVKKDSHENIVPDSAPNNKKPAELMLATKGKEVTRVTFREPIVESEQANCHIPNFGM